MADLDKIPVPPRSRMASYRQRMRSAGLRPVQLWVPDTRDAAFVDSCRRQARAVAAYDPAGDELLDFVEAARDWPEA